MLPGSRRPDGLAVAAAILLVFGCKDSGSAKAPPPPTVDTAPKDSVAKALAAIVATAAETNGTVEVRRKGEAHWSPVTVGTTFMAGDWIQTKDGSSVRIRVLSGKDEITLEANAAMIVDAAYFAADTTAEPTAQSPASTVVAVQRGVVRGVIGGQPDGAGQPLIIRHSDGSEAELRQAGDSDVTFRLTAGQESVEVAVTGGTLAVASTTGKQEVTKGQVTSFRGGEVAAVRTMLRFPRSVLPGIDARFQYQHGMVIPLSWKAVPNAARYHVQIATELSFREIVSETLVTGTKLEFAPPRAGAYAWRVAAVDKTGTLGEYGFSRRIFCETEPPRDLLIAPADGTKIAFDKQVPTIEFAWQSAGGAKGYVLLVGRTEDPRREPVIEERTAEQSIRIDTLTGGAYFWGIYAEGERLEPVFLTPRRLTIQKRNAPQVKTENLWDD